MNSFDKGVTAGAIALVLTVLAAISTPAWSQTSRQARYWSAYSHAEHDLIGAWRDDASPSVYADAVYRLTKFQVYLLSSHVSADDPRLLGPVLTDPAVRVKSRYDYARLGYRVFQYDLKRLTGFEIRPQRLFDDISDQGDQQ